VLFQDPDEERARRLSRAADAVRERFGSDALQRARLLRREDREKDEASSPPSVD
jgi:hypothetical protein